MQNTNIEKINSLDPTFLPKAKKSGYICPVCNSGAGKNGTGIALNKGTNHWHCFNCGLNEDVIGLYGKYTNITDFKEQLAGAAKYFNILLEEDYTHTHTHTHNEQEQEEQLEDYTDFYNAAHKNISLKAYIANRGISKSVIDRFNLGYVEKWTHPKAPKATPTERLIIPINEHCYFARDIREEEKIPAQQKPYTKQKIVSGRNVSQTFNLQALTTATQPIFVVEGEIDALSIITCGAEAVAIGSASYINSFIKEVEKNKPQNMLVLALDNDNAGKQAEDRLATELLKRNIPFYRADLYGIFKDANEILVKSRNDLIANIGYTLNKIENIAEEEKKAYKDSYSAAGLMTSFIQGINESVNTTCMRTGFNALDNVLDGGLYEGLYVIGAISSLGKTSYVLQMCDQIAEHKQDVLYFSLEMAAYELMAKSISRNTALLAIGQGLQLNNAKSARGITSVKRYSNYTDKEKKLIVQAEKKYSEVAGNIYFKEGIGDIGIEQIKQALEQHISFTGNKPAIVIDYMQILTPYNERLSDKQNMDRIILELKKISRDYKIPVIVISSFNRENYNNVVDFKSFKESGAIEYSADVLLGLQFKGVGTSSFDSNAAKEKSPREIELVILKNRYGKAGGKIDYQFYPMFNYFIELNS